VISTVRPASSIPDSHHQPGIRRHSQHRVARLRRREAGVCAWKPSTALHTHRCPGPGPRGPTLRRRAEACSRTPTVDPGETRKGLARGWRNAGSGDGGERLRGVSHRAGCHRRWPSRTSPRSTASPPTSVLAVTRSPPTGSPPAGR
jgi:hypothetical protein